MHLKRLLKHTHFWLIISLLVFDGLFFGLTDPNKVSSIFLIVGFLLWVFTLYCLLRGLLALSSWYGLPFNKHGRRLARVITVALSGLIALQSVGQLGSRDILVLLPLTVVGYLYMTYGRTVQRE